ncbi:MAG: M20 family metallopeptidase [Thermodesulfobacteriota bacterium]
MKDWLVRHRRYFHLHPETSDNETATTNKIAAILQELGVEVQTFEGMTGVAGLIKAREPHKTIALRADIDALPIQEMNDVPYKSGNNEVMHACGHDGHISIILGVVKKIQESRLSEKLNGNLKFIFQPAEELGTGAKRLIENGVLENPHVDFIIGCHLFPDLPLGTVGINRTQGFASADRFSLIIRGKGAHAAHPHEGIDPIVAGAFFVTAIQSIIGRNVSPLESGVITVARFMAGDAANVIPRQAELQGTIRALNNALRDKLISRMREVTEATQKGFNVSCDFQLHESAPACINHEEVSLLLHEAASRVVGAEKVKFMNPTMGAEDFAFYTLERPGAIFRLGCSNKERGLTHPLHSPYFDFDEDALVVGVDVFVEAIKRFLG